MPASDRNSRYGAEILALSPGSAATPDEYRLWLALVEQAARSELLERRLEEVRASRSWRLTAPLRWLLGAVKPKQKSRPDLAGPTRSGRTIGASDEGRSRLFVDVTELALEDLGAGVQRVTRRLLGELLLAPPAGFQVQPVRLTHTGEYVLARAFLAEFAGLSRLDAGEDCPIDPRTGDVFFALDLCRDRSAQLAPAIARVVDAGVPVTFLLHDVLPLTHPEWFPADIGHAFESWLKVVLDTPSRVLCVSRASADQLQSLLETRRLPAPREGIVPISLGCDLLPSVPKQVLPVRTPGSARVLMVGTVEPRKCHAQALDGFETLWARGEQCELVVVGKPGWLVDELLSRLRNHPERGRRLHWIEDADDRTLAALYRECDVLLMASKGEGFGLPIIEAGDAGLALLLRDLPVFREVAGPRANYFDGDGATELANALQAQLREPFKRDSAGPKWPTWAMSAEAIKSLIIPKVQLKSGTSASSKADEENQ